MARDVLLLFNSDETILYTGDRLIHGGVLLLLTKLQPPASPFLTLRMLPNGQIIEEIVYLRVFLILLLLVVLFPDDFVQFRQERRPEDFRVRESGGVQVVLGRELRLGVCPFVD